MSANQLEVFVHLPGKRPQAVTTEPEVTVNPGAILDHRNGRII